MYARGASVHAHEGSCMEVLMGLGEERYWAVEGGVGEGLGERCGGMRCVRRKGKR